MLSDNDFTAKCAVVLKGRMVKCCPPDSGCTNWYWNEVNGNIFREFCADDLLAVLDAMGIKWSVGKDDHGRFCKLQGMPYVYDRAIHAAMRSALERRFEAAAEAAQ